MSLAIRALPIAARGECKLCATHGDLSSWDSNLGGRICQECEPLLEAAERALVASRCGHPDDTLIAGSIPLFAVAYIEVLSL